MDTIIDIIIAALAGGGMVALFNWLQSRKKNEIDAGYLALKLAEQQSKKIDALEKEIADLKKRNDELEKENVDLRARLEHLEKGSNPD